MIENECEYCKQKFQRKGIQRFCSCRCRYFGLAALGYRPPQRPRTEETKQKIREARARQGSNVWNRGKSTGSAWNKGLTKETSEAVRVNAEKVGIAQRGKKRGALSVDTKKKLSEGRKGVLNWAKKPETREKIKQSMLKLYQQHPELLQQRKPPTGHNQFSGAFNSLEAKVRDSLHRLGVAYTHNYQIGKYWADFLILDRVVIECDGAYWHQDKEQECLRNSYLMDRGYFVFHLLEADILADSSACVRKVLQVYTPFEETRV